MLQVMVVRKAQLREFEEFAWDNVAGIRWHYHERRVLEHRIIRPDSKSFGCAGRLLTPEMGAALCY